MSYSLRANGLHEFVYNISDILIQSSSFDRYCKSVENGQIWYSLEIGLNGENTAPARIFNNETHVYWMFMGNHIPKNKDQGTAVFSVFWNIRYSSAKQGTYSQVYSLDNFIVELIQGPLAFINYSPSFVGQLETVTVHSGQGIKQFLSIAANDYEKDDIVMKFGDELTDTLKSGFYTVKQQNVD